MRALYACASDTVILPMQDILGLGSETRMNNPSAADGNWSWRVRADALTDRLAGELHELARVYDRLPSPRA
jgi:4-alpha-glucanotransferase